MDHAVVDHEELAEAQQRYRTISTQLGMTKPDTLLNTLSGGMLKKIAIARALAFESDLLTLDEPTNDLDVETLRVLEQYQELHRLHPSGHS